MTLRKPSVIIIYGYPGSGKGTQAEKLAGHFGFEHFNTGGVIEKTIHDPVNQNDPIIEREKNLFDSGILCTPEWVAEVVKKVIEDLREKDKSIIFSGSPRTLYEAERLTPFLEELYGRDNIFPIEVKIKPETAIFRNSHRRICEKNAHPLIYSSENEKLEFCPICGSKLVIRVLDTPETIKVRIREYEDRTEPILEYLKKRGYNIIEADGEPEAGKVFEDILSKLKL